MTAELPVLPSAADTSRRRWLRDQLALLAAPALGVPGRADAAPYGVTIAAMQAARENETGVHHHYTEFGRQASRDGYRGVAYLFHAIAASELVHATSFGKVLTRLGVEPVPIPRPAVRAGTTRENLMMGFDVVAGAADVYGRKIRSEIELWGRIVRENQINVD